MGKRNNDGTWHDSCLDKLKPGEPFFVLRGQDKLAPYLIRQWAEQAEIEGCPGEKVAEALNTANELEDWPDRKFPD